MKVRFHLSVKHLLNKTMFKVWDAKLNHLKSDTSSDARFLISRDLLTGEALFVPQEFLLWDRITQYLFLISKMNYIRLLNTFKIQDMWINYSMLLINPDITEEKNIVKFWRAIFADGFNDLESALNLRLKTLRDFVKIRNRYNIELGSVKNINQLSSQE